MTAESELEKAQASATVAGPGPARKGVLVAEPRAEWAKRVVWALTVSQGSEPVRLPEDSSESQEH